MATRSQQNVQALFNGRLGCVLALAIASRTCEEALAASTDVKIDADAVQALAAELPAATAVAAACQFMRLPIRFDSLQAEVGTAQPGAGRVCRVVAGKMSWAAVRQPWQNVGGVLPS